MIVKYETYTTMARKQLIEIMYAKAVLNLQKARRQRKRIYKRISMPNKKGITKKAIIPAGKPPPSIIATPAHNHTNTNPTAVR